MIDFDAPRGAEWPVSREVYAYFDIRSETLRPEHIGHIVGMPTESETLKGSEREPPRPRPTHHRWGIKVASLSEINPRYLLEKLLAKVAPIITAVPELRRADPAVKFSVSMYVYPATPKPEFFFRPPLFFPREIIRTLADLDADLDINLVGSPEQFVD